MLIGKSRTKHRPYGTIRPHGTMESHTCLDGLLDELKIYDRALDETEIAAAYTKHRTTVAPPCQSGYSRPVPRGRPVSVPSMPI